MSEEQEIIFTEITGRNGNVGLITLNRSKVLNALNHTMFVAFNKQLMQWADNDAIKAVIVRAAPGRAFSAGGDIRYAYEKGLAKDPTLMDFFGDEYRLDQNIYHYPKPYIALMNGMTMGGGAGISVNGAYRVATENLIFSMPETGIGFYPDIGASYFLSRLPGKMGLYLGLTGDRIAHNDCFALGLVNYVVSSTSLDDLISAIVETSLEKHTDRVVSEVINQFSLATEKSKLLTLQPEIDTCFSKNSMEDILTALEHFPNAWCQQVDTNLRTKSPTSLKVTLKQLQRGATLTFDECIKLEYYITSQFVKGHDFYEGVRAAIIDKDQQPKWKPETLDEVTISDVEAYFAPLEKV